MVRNRYSASFAGVVGLVSDARDSFAGSVTVRGVVAVRANAVGANHNSAVETIPGDTDLHAAPDIGASRAAGRPVDYSGDLNKRALTVVAALRLAVAVHSGVAANPDSAESAVVGVAVPNAAVAECAVLPDSVARAGGFVPVPRAVVPGSAEHAGDFAPSAVAVPADSVAPAGGSVPSVDSAQLAALRVALHAGAAARRPAAAHDVDPLAGVAAVEFAVAARALAVVRCGWLPVALFVDLFVPDFPGSVPARGHGALVRS